MRLTQKDKESGFYYLPEQFEEYQEDVDFEPTITKLGQLEDIEDELGIDLITLFKALKQGYWCIKKEITHVNRTTDFPFVHTIWEGDNGWYIMSEEGNYNMFYENKLKDYGKTWALTKEELE